MTCIILIIDFCQFQPDRDHNYAYPAHKKP